MSARPLTRGRITAVAVVAAIVIVAVTVILWYRSTGPRIENVGFGVGGPSRVGEPVNVGVPLRATGGRTTLSNVTFAQWATSPSRVASGATDVDVTWSRLDGRGVGVLLGDLGARGHDPQPVAGSPLTNALDQFVVASITPHQAGVYRFEGVRITYGEGLRRRTTAQPVSVCIVAVDADEELPTADAIDCDALAPGRGG